MKTLSLRILKEINTSDLKLAIIVNADSLGSIFRLTKLFLTFPLPNLLVFLDRLWRIG